MKVLRVQRGFTLIEVLVAFALLAIGLGLLLAILSDGVRSVASSSQSTQATLYAQSLLTTLGSDHRLKPGHSQGAFDNGRYRWTLDIKPFKPPAPPPAPPSAQGNPYADQGVQAVADNILLRVLLQMQWGPRGDQSLRVDTLRAYAPDTDATQ
jgi:general secretion pathway protein I